MYESNKLRRQRRQRLAIGAGVLALVLVCGLGAVLFFALGADHKAAGCVIADVSESTEEARPRYVGAFRDFATEIGTEGSGKLCLVVAAAHPLTEGTPVPAYVGPDPGDAGKAGARGQVEEHTQVVTAQFSHLLSHPSVDEKGSALVEAATEAANVLEPGDRLLFLSDGLQWSRLVGHLQDMELDPVTIGALMEKLRRLGLLPDLKGVRVEFPFLLLHPGGLPGDESEVLGIQEFWKTWAHETGAEIVLPGES